MDPPALGAPALKRALDGIFLLDLTGHAPYRHVHSRQRLKLDRNVQDTIRRILTARVYDVAEETPLDPLRRLSARLDRPVLLKREDLQPVFSFKIRGAYNKIASLSEADLARGVICA